MTSGWCSGVDGSVSLTLLFLPLGAGSVHQWRDRRPHEPTLRPVLWPVRLGHCGELPCPVVS